MKKFLIGLVCVGCTQTFYPPRPEPVPDAGTPPDCAAACARMTELGCEESKPTPNGSTCEEVCNNVESSGVITIQPACVVEIESCDQINGCIQ